MTALHSLRLPTLLANLTALLPLGCGSHDTDAAAPAASATSSATTTASAAPKSAAKVAPYTYAAPVSGQCSDSDAGDFELVDGLAWTSSSGSGTVVYVTGKAIASPALAASPAPMSEARALALLRDAGYAEVTLDGSGKSSYFASGTQLGGRSREEDSGGRYWKIEPKKSAAGHAAASVTHKSKGAFTFDLPVVKPKLAEVSEGDRVQGRRSPEGAATPSEEAVLEVYRALHKAAKAKDLAAFLAAQGFSAELSAAVRGLPGIEADFAVFADRFLTPGEAVEPTAYEGYGGVRARGVNSKGETYSNYYEFAPCGERLLLIGISEEKKK